MNASLFVELHGNDVVLTNRLGVEKPFLVAKIRCNAGYLTGPDGIGGTKTFRYVDDSS